MDNQLISQIDTIGGQQNEINDAFLIDEPLTFTEREARKPDISRLPDAVDINGIPSFDIGEKIIIERRSVVLEGRPYIDTKTYTVKSLNVNTGDMLLFDESLHQSAMSNYIEGLKKGFVFKLSRGNQISTKKKRGRPRKNPIVDKVAQAELAAQNNDGVQIKRKRGRPPGTKNRDKATIKAEKKAKQLEKLKKHEARRAMPPKGAKSKKLK